MFNLKGLALVLSLSMLLPLAGCSKNADDVLRLFVRGEPIADDALRQVRAAAKELEDSDEAKLVCTVSTEVASTQVDKWDPTVSETELAAQPASTAAGRQLRELVASANNQSQTKAAVKLSIEIFDRAMC